MSTLPLLIVAATLAAPATRPNIVFILTDDHAAHAISSYGSVINETPNLDRIAAEGARFTNCFCDNSICGPSRATILTGVYSHVHGFNRNGRRFNPNQPTFAAQLDAEGYDTAMFGKWHLGTNPVGFDAWEILPGQGDYYSPVFIPKDAPDTRVEHEGYVTDVITDKSIAWLRDRTDDTPFLLLCHHKAPHRRWMPGPEELDLFADEDLPVPDTLFDDYEGRTTAAQHQEMTIARHMWMHYDLKVPEATTGSGPDRWAPNVDGRMNEEQRAAWDAAYGPRNAAFMAAALEGDELVEWKYQRYVKDYLRCIAGVDRNVGRLLDAIDELGHADNTIVIYASDQGFYLGDHGWYDKRWMYEESLRMPLLVRWPGHIEPGTVVESLVQNTDFAPTLIEAAGAEPIDRIQGRSLMPLFGGDEPADWRDEVYYHYYQSRSTHQVAAHDGVRTNRYKLIHYYEGEYDEWELFDLEKDPDELSSMHDDPAYQEIRRELEGALRDQRRRLGVEIQAGPSIEEAIAITTSIRPLEASVSLLPAGLTIDADNRIDSPSDANISIPMPRTGSTPIAGISEKDGFRCVQVSIAPGDSPFFDVIRDHSLGPRTHIRLVDDHGRQYAPVGFICMAGEGDAVRIRLDREKGFPTLGALAPRTKGTYRLMFDVPVGTTIRTLYAGTHEVGRCRVEVRAD